MACANNSLENNRTASNWHTMDIRLAVNRRRELRGVCSFVKSCHLMFFSSLEFRALDFIYQQYLQPVKNKVCI